MILQVTSVNSWCHFGSRYRHEVWSHLHLTSHGIVVFCFIRLAISLKAPLFPFRGLLTFFFFWKPGQPPLLNPSGSLPNPSYIPSSTHPKPPCCCRSPRQRSSLQEIPRGRVSKLYICSFHLKNVSGSVPSSLALLFHSSFLPALSSPASPQAILVYGFPHAQLNSLNLITVISTSRHAPPTKKSVETLKKPKRPLLIPDNSISALSPMPSLTWRGFSPPSPAQILSTFHCTGLENVQRVSGSQWILTFIHLPNACCTQLRPRSYHEVCWNPTIRFDHLMREVCIPYLCTLGSSIWPVSPDTSCTNQLPSPTAMLFLLPFPLSEIPLLPGLFSCPPPIYTLRVSWNVSFPITFPPIPLSGSILLCLGGPEHSIFSIPSGKYHFVSCVSCHFYLLAYHLLEGGVYIWFIFASSHHFCMYTQDKQ